MQPKSAPTKQEALVLKDQPDTLLGKFIRVHMTPFRVVLCILQPDELSQRSITWHGRIP